MLKEPISGNKAGSLLPEALEICVAAFAEHIDRLAVIQAHHANKALGIDLLILMANSDPEGLHSSQSNKGFYFSKRMYLDWKLMHCLSPHSVQKRKNVYNGGGQSSNCTLLYRLFVQNAIVALADYHKNKRLNLVNLYENRILHLGLQNKSI